MLFAAVVIYSNCISQPYISTSILRTGVAGNIGFLADKLDVSFGLQFPITEVLVPTVYSLSAGRMFNISHNEADNFTITPAVGVAAINKVEVLPANTFSEKYGRSFPYETFKNANAIKPYFSLEAGKDAHIGRVFVKAVYTEKIYYAIGMRVFLNRN